MKILTFFGLFRWKLSPVGVILQWKSLPFDVFNRPELMLIIDLYLFTTASFLDNHACVLNWAWWPDYRLVSAAWGRGQMVQSASKIRLRSGFDVLPYQFNMPMISQEGRKSWTLQMRESLKQEHRHGQSL